ncbi:MAG: DUF1294 domain-containing protein [Firmicutes bacterium]|nr:DUF1294 domain-containing protein [Bacillota bacterium]
MIYIIIIINIISLFTYKRDKGLAIKNKFRISEKTLVSVSIIAPFGALLGMKRYRHKTKKIKFKFAILLGFIIYIGIIYIIYTENLLNYL